MRGVVEVACFFGSAVLAYMRFQGFPLVVTIFLSELVALAYYLATANRLEDDDRQAVFRRNTGMLVVAPFLALIWNSGFVIAFLLVVQGVAILVRVIRGRDPVPYDSRHPFSSGR